MGELVRDLKVGSEQLIETHISWVFLHARDAFKLKKPVDLGFLDFSEQSSRERACHAELELNSRLAPGIYRAVLPVWRDAQGQHAIGGEEQGRTLVDHVVHMERLPEAARADLRLGRGTLAAADVDALARRLARFHAGAAVGAPISEFGRVERIRANVEENFNQAGDLLQRLGPANVEREVEARQLGFLNARADLFARRIEGGYIRDGHGDLRLEHVYLLEGREPVVIDCIEFNERFRYADVCADLAFLSMDLGWHGRLDLKERLLATYASQTWDHDLYALVDFYESYRAYVRAKVAAFSLASGSLSFSARERLEAGARRYLLLALAVERPPLAAPRLLAVGGLIASGKSSVAQALGQRLGVPVIGSDETRKRSRGVEPMTPLHDGAWQGAYDAGSTERVYAELMRRARVVLESGRSVVVDASFRSRADRAALREVAHAAGASFAFIECRVSEELARARLAERARGPSVSDGRQLIYAEFAARYEAVTELPPAEYLRLDTSGSLEESLLALERAGFAPLSDPMPSIPAGFVPPPLRG